MEHESKHIPSKVGQFCASPLVLSLFSLFVLIVISFIFKWNRDIDSDLKADTDVIGTFGDFFGGVIGTIFALVSVYWMAEAFKQQRDESKSSRRQVDENHRQLEVQRFNELFFELLRMYQYIVSDLNGTVYRVLPEEVGNGGRKFTEEVYDNKDFFDVEKRKLQKKFVPDPNLKQSQINATSEYLDFYARNPKLGAYYRVLFRIFEMINRQSEAIRNKSKDVFLTRSDIRDYIKIVRAQLTESELFFLRYNALTPYGTRFAPLIDRFNLLKHLAPFDLLEYKSIWSKLSTVEAGYMNIHYRLLKREIMSTLHNFDKDEQKGGDHPHQRRRYKGRGAVKYNIIVDAPSKTEVSVSLIQNNDIGFTAREFEPFDKFDIKELTAILGHFCYEIFIHSHLKRGHELRLKIRNVLETVTTYKDGEKIDKYTIKFLITSKDSTPLINRFPHITYWDN